MALPFVLGLAVGAGAVLAFKNSDKLQEKAASLFDKSKALANCSLDKANETVTDVKDTISATAECIKEKKASSAKIENKSSEDKE